MLGPVVHAGKTPSSSLAIHGASQERGRVLPTAVSELEVQDVVADLDRELEQVLLAVLDQVVHDDALER